MAKPSTGVDSKGNCCAKRHEWGSHSQVVGQEHLREAKPAIGSACHRRAANGLAVANWLAHQRQTLELERRFQRPPSTSDLPSNDAHRSPVGGRPRVRGSVDLREDHGCYGCRRIQKSVTLTRAFILCCCPGARSTAKGPTLLVSIQIICFHSSSAKSDKECAFSTHGFHTTVVREFSFVTRVRRCKTGSSSSIAPVAFRYFPLYGTHAALLRSAAMYSRYSLPQAPG